jgi:hypothetical protein
VPDEPTGPTTMQVPDPSVDLERALTELIEARQRLEEAEDELDAAREGAHLALRRLGAFLLYQGEAVPHGLLRRLYWEYPDLHVDVMAKAFGLQNNEVGRYAGPGVRQAPCQRCGTQVTHTFPSRSAVRRGRSGRRLRSSDWRLCPPCREVLQAEEREEQARWRREWEAYEQEVEEQRRLAHREGRYRIRRYIQYEGVLARGSWTTPTPIPTTPIADGHRCP